ncbi:MAG: hypothetical protein NT069_21540, partial [Planctomycetota bacterium]|nr:hypothetical protein [Planctomycetota bacterium]
DAFCVWLSRPTNALSDAGLGDQLAGASLWRLAFDAPAPPNSTSTYWWQQRWAVHAGAFYWPLTVGIPAYIAGGQLDVDPEDIGGYASFIRSEWETRPFRCLHPNPFDLVEQSAETGQFPATLLIEPWWP